MLRLWFKALGAKDGSTNKEANTIAWIRTFIILSYFITNGTIIAGVIHQW